ncbi:MAG: FG-GAP repeat protein, partial [Planctomycetota bacterium]
MARTDLLPLLSLLSPAICAPVLAQAPAPSFPSEVLFPPYTSSSSADELANGGLAVGSSFVAATAPQRASEGVALIWPRAGAAFGAPELVLSPQTTTSNRFGQALDFNGDELAISELRSGLFGNLGAVHLYERVAGQWQRTESLADPGGVFILSFGDSLGFDGDTVVAGSPSAFVQGQSRGAVYVFRRTGGAFALEATLTASNGALGDRFGDDVAVSGDRLVASAPGHGATGAAYVFERSGGAWSEVAVLGLPAGSSDDGFGSDVDVDGTTVAVGAQTGNDVGTVHVFVESAGVWTLEQRIQPRGLTAFARFGSAVDLAGDRLAVGAPGDSATGFGLGSSWTFQRTGGVWAARARLVQSLDTPAGLFGTSVVTD